MKKIGICGHFGDKKNFLDGQTVKTKIITQELEKIYSVKTVDTFNGKKRILIILIRLIKLLIQCENIIILPAQNSLRIIAPFLVFFNTIFKRKLHYVVIGGWLSTYLKDKEKLKKILKIFDYIYVETSIMKNSLESQGFKNIIVMPNCKKLEILEEKNLVYNKNKPYKLCIFSRVMKEKGIQDAIEAIIKYNQNSGEIIYTLDIYGQIDDSQKDWFNKVLQKLPWFIQYKGFVQAEKSVMILKNYYALLFPTKFYTEGVPGTIIDAYSAGIPVISSKWESFSDVIDERITGYGYAFENQKEFIEILDYFANNVESINSLKKMCIRKAKEYIPKEVIKIILTRI